jgi:Zn-dependent protease
MRAWSIPLGKFFGIEVRLHLTFFLLLALLVTQTMKAGIVGSRGVVLFFAVLAAVAVHEAARAIFTPTKRDKLQRLVLLPIGGVILGETSDRNSEKHASLAQEARAALAGPLAILILAGIGAALASSLVGVEIFATPYIHSAHLTRSIVWITAGLGLLNLIPAYPLAAGRVLRVWLAQNAGPDVPDPWQEATRKSVSYGQGFSMLLTVMGLIAGNVWAFASSSPRISKTAACFSSRSSQACVWKRSCSPTSLCSRQLTRCKMPWRKRCTRCRMIFRSYAAEI